MSRVAKAPIALGSGLDVKIDGRNITVKGSKGTLNWTLHPEVTISQEDGQLVVKPVSETSLGWMHAGTTRAIVNNMVVGCREGFSRKLTLVGVGYRAQSKGKVLNLSLGFSHPVDYDVPEGITIETP